MDWTSWKGSLVDRDQIHQIELMGRVYSLRSPETPETIKAIADLVRDKMEQIEQATATVDSLKLGVLTALNLADDFIKLKSEYEMARETWLGLEKELLTRIIQALKSDPEANTPA